MRHFPHGGSIGWGLQDSPHDQTSRNKNMTITGIIVPFLINWIKKIMTQNV